ncbi:MAG: DegT/DnrJ/EryC1/StrS family aminotransferase [Candidatus Sumerlaeaceae bacterium]|jgi:dTDP-4-amino-4,6-dideoxygalactose transaminase
MSTTWRIPLCDLTYDELEERAVLDVLRSKWLTIGPRTLEFEERLAAYLGVRHVIAVANCTAALELAYRLAFHTAPNHSRFVVVPTMTFVATANAVIAAGGTPILVDSLADDDPRIDPKGVEQAINEHGGAHICAMHYAGVDVGTQHLQLLAEQAGGWLIEDAAHAIGGTTAAGLKLGTSGHLGCFSFFSNKNLATGEGGALVTNDDELARLARLLRGHGLTSSTAERHFARVGAYDVVEFGHNFRWTEISAALGLVQLVKLDEMNQRRRELLRRYAGNLEGTKGARILFAEDATLPHSAAHLCVAAFSTSTIRDRVRDVLHQHGIQTSHHYRPVHTFQIYRNRAAKNSGLRVMPCPNAEKFSDRVLTLPLYPKLSESAVDEICDLIRSTVAATGEPI